MDVTPLVPEGLQIIESYGGGGFRVSGKQYSGNTLVLPGRTLAWTPRDIAALVVEDFATVLTDAPSVEVLLIGCGPAMVFIDPDLREAVRAQGPALEPMDTGAACRTYNVLAAEGRPVAAALIAVD
ncbi:Mth938-like domain-containing protein [Pelagibius sp.]|uniref:Mth938-like domain-containing protein n=1 Tax=Pelagibius sp. TaxID=1931238 RepID=UPI003B50CA0B